MKRLQAGALAAILAVPAALAPATAHAAGPAHYTGTLPDGATWIADVPARWNGTLILFSHGFGPLTPADRPSEAAGKALLDRGYALAGSSYDPDGSLWALGSAVRDQIAAKDAVTKIIGRPRTTLALGQSMGGLVSAKLAETRAVDGVLSTCGIVGGGVDLNNYQLNAGHAIATLLAPSQDIKLTDYTSPAEGIVAGTQLTLAVQNAQATPAGPRPHSPGLRLPQPVVLVHRRGRTTPPRLRRTGTPAVPVAHLRRPRVHLQRPLLHQPGRGRRQRLEQGPELLTPAHPLREPPPGEGPLPNRGPEPEEGPLNPHHKGHQTARTGPSRVDDAHIRTHGPHHRPDAEHPHDLRPAGPGGARDRVRQNRPRRRRTRLLRQAYVHRTGHCNFAASEYVASLQTLEKRVKTNHWPSTTPKSLNQKANALSLDTPAFHPHNPNSLLVQPSRP
ncbi:hypothetical protein LUX33_41215 [Actinomadura madurae]|uniref:hypothetical protein n=1 Tax=Actinomadura madurae TaxID=1993 RepID=UPI0020D23D58|nr:hypothetical protein [Actinomadura madurae]MCP9954203.1 hypothetical protein [Actinomadura madurae]